MAYEAMLLGVDDDYGWPAAGRWPVPGSRRWRVSGQITGAALLGVLVAAVVAGIWRNSLRVEASSCTNGGVVCLGPAFGGMIAGAVVVLAGTLTGFALLRIRPLAATVPAGAVIAYVAIRAVTTASALPIGEMPVPWLLAPVVAAGFALVAAAAVLPGRARLAALAAVGVFVLGGLVGPPVTGHRVQSDKEQASLAALPVPLQLPVVAGYKVGDAFADNGTTLWISMVASHAQPDRWGAYDTIAFTVTISPAAQQAGLPGTPGPGDTAPVISHNLGSVIVTVIHGTVAVTATTNTSGVPVSALEQAVTDLRPATAAQIQALAGS